MAGKERKSSEKQPKGSRLPLGADADAVADAGKRRRSGTAKRHQAEEEASVPSSISAKILREALKQQEEGLPESREQLPSDAPAASSTSSFVPIPVNDDDDDDDDDDDEEDVDGFDSFDAQSEYDGGVPEIDEEDEKALAAFMPRTPLPSNLLVISFSRRSERRTPPSRQKDGVLSSWTTELLNSIKRLASS
ncbi:hypothetical protein ACQ4PT_030224 [Festuca glaucescens]